MSESLEDIFNYRAIDSKLALGGQPLEEQLSLIEEAAFEVIIHLDVDEAAYTVLDEKTLVQMHGMDYAPLAISFTQPTRIKVEHFLRLMRKYQGRKTFVHCTAGYGSSAVLLIYLVLERGYTYDEAHAAVLPDWQPTDAWQSLIDEMLSAKTD